MPVTRTEINTAQEVIGVLVGDRAEAEAYARDPEGWLDDHGYAAVSAEALATSAEAHATTTAPPVSAGAVAQLDSIVYNHYDTDDAIIDNIVNHGTAFSADAFNGLKADADASGGDAQAISYAGDVVPTESLSLNVSEEDGLHISQQNIQDDTLASLEELGVSQVTILGGSNRISADDLDRPEDQVPQDGPDNGDPDGG